MQSGFVRNKPLRLPCTRATETTQHKWLPSKQRPTRHNRCQALIRDGNYKFPRPYHNAANSSTSPKADAMQRHDQGQTMLRKRNRAGRPNKYRNSTLDHTRRNQRAQSPPFSVEV